MTRAEYEAMMERVLNEAQRLEVDGREVVLVMSRRVYRAIHEFEQAEPLRLLNTEPYAYGAYYGMRIGVINESEDRLIADVQENMIAPALVGMTYNPAVNRLDDVIVVSEENGNHLYQMTREHPAQFDDIGFTVSFEVAWHQQMDTDNTAADAVAAAVVNNGLDGVHLNGGQLYINGDDGRFINIGDLAFTEALEDVGATAATTATAINDMAATFQATVTPEDMERIAEAFANARPEMVYPDTVTTDYAGYTIPRRETPLEMRRNRGKRREVVIEPELNPGDTKLLDEFLDSFKHSSLMQMGG